MRIASIGYGNMGAKYARMIYDNLIPDMTLTCVCVHHAETIEKVREDLGNDVVCTVGKDDLFSHSDLFDEVLIAVPHPSHFQYFKTAAEKGKHVLCEKPASITAKEAEEMESLAEEKHITYGLIFQHRFFARNQYIKDLLETGRLGKIERADLSMSMFRTPAYHKAGSWRSSWKGEGGGLLINQAQHVLDVYQWLFGMPEALRADIEFGKYNDFNVDDQVSMNLYYKDRMSSHLFFTTGEPHEFVRLEIAGTKGSLIMEGHEITLHMFSEDQRDYCAETTCTNAKELGIREERIRMPDDDKDAKQKVLIDFAQAVKEGRKPKADGTAGIHALQLSNAAYLSAWKGQKVNIETACEEYPVQLKKKIAEEEV